MSKGTERAGIKGIVPNEDAVTKADKAFKALEADKAKRDQEAEEQWFIENKEILDEMTELAGDIEYLRDESLPENNSPEKKEQLKKLEAEFSTIFGRECDDSFGVKEASWREDIRRVVEEIKNKSNILTNNNDNMKNIDQKLSAIPPAAETAKKTNKKDLAHAQEDKERAEKLQENIAKIKALEGKSFFIKNSTDGSSKEYEIAGIVSNSKLQKVKIKPVGSTKKNEIISYGFEEFLALQLDSAAEKDLAAEPVATASENSPKTEEKLSKKEMDDKITALYKNNQDVFTKFSAEPWKIYQIDVDPKAKKEKIVVGPNTPEAKNGKVGVLKNYDSFEEFLKDHELGARNLEEASKVVVTKANNKVLGAANIEDPRPKVSPEIKKNISTKELANELKFIEELAENKTPVFIEDDETPWRICYVNADLQLVGVEQDGKPERKYEFGDFLRWQKEDRPSKKNNKKSPKVSESAAAEAKADEPKIIDENEAQPGEALTHVSVADAIAVWRERNKGKKKDKQDQEASRYTFSDREANRDKIPAISRKNKTKINNNPEMTDAAVADQERLDAAEIKAILDELRGKKNTNTGGPERYTYSSNEKNRDTVPAIKRRGGATSKLEQDEEDEESRGITTKLEPLGDDSGDALEQLYADAASAEKNLNRGRGAVASNPRRYAQAPENLNLNKNVRAPERTNQNRNNNRGGVVRTPEKQSWWRRLFGA